MANDTNMCTMVTIPVADSTYQTVKRFCEDFGIENVPLRKNMCFEVCIRYGLHEPDPMSNQITYYADELALEVDEASDGQGSVLLLYFNSPPLEELYEKRWNSIPEDERFDEDGEPLTYVVISNDFDSKDADLTKMETALKSYLGEKITFGETLTRYETDENIENFLLDGKEVDEY